MLEATYCILIFLTLAATNKIQIYIHISKWCDQRKTVMRGREREKLIIQKQILMNLIYQKIGLPKHKDSSG